MLDALRAREYDFARRLMGAGLALLSVSRLLTGPGMAVALGRLSANAEFRPGVFTDKCKEYLT